MKECNSYVFSHVLTEVKGCSTWEFSGKEPRVGIKTSQHGSIHMCYSHCGCIISHIRIRHNEVCRAYAWWDFFESRHEWMHQERSCCRHGTPRKGNIHITPDIGVYETACSQGDAPSLCLCVCACVCVFVCVCVCVCVCVHRYHIYTCMYL